MHIQTWIEQERNITELETFINTVISDPIAILSHLDKFIETKFVINELTIVVSTSYAVSTTEFDPDDSGVSPLIEFCYITYNDSKLRSSIQRYIETLESNLTGPYVNTMIRAVHVVYHLHKCKQIASDLDQALYIRQNLTREGVLCDKRST